MLYMSTHVFLASSQKRPLFFEQITIKVIFIFSIIEWWLTIAIVWKWKSSQLLIEFMRNCNPWCLLVMIKGERKKASKQRANTTECCKCKINKPVYQTVMVKRTESNTAFQMAFVSFSYSNYKTVELLTLSVRLITSFFSEYWMCR